jgi:hypothetical protein
MTTNTEHDKAIQAAKLALASMERMELLNRRTLVEAVIRQAEKQGLNWREIKPDDEADLSVAEQYDLIDEALRNLDPDQGTIVNAKTGKAVVHTNK